MDRDACAAKQGGPVSRLPPGFRFHPTDEELVEQYLKRKVFRFPLPSFLIPEVELSRYDPWSLPGGPAGDGERYLFNAREGKYGYGGRPNRAGASGYWKATGKDRVVVASRGGHVVGMKKVLVFHRGKHPRGSRTNWVMHEYRLGGLAGAVAGRLSLQAKTSNNPKLRMEDWVLCRIFQRKRASRRGEGMEADDAEVAPDFDDEEEDRVSGLSCVTEELDDGSSSEDETGSSR